jgi:hypothetical protein
MMTFSLLVSPFAIAIGLAVAVKIFLIKKL